MAIIQKTGLSILIVVCAAGSLEDAIRILAMLCTLALASYLSAARQVDNNRS